MTETKLKIDGMMCGMCESHINDAIRRAFNVKKVTSSHSKGETVVLSEEPLDEEKLRAAIKETGYDLVSICLLYTSPSPRDRQKSRMPSSA